jgi:simple sugar transport system substrate-binding protein
MKKQLTVILFALILVMLLGAVPTALPATAAPVVSLVDAPRAVLPSEPAAQTADKWCSNLRIVFFPGGPQGGVFAVNVYNGAVAAQNDMGPKVDYVWSDWDTQKMIQQFRESAATKPDGIAVMGHPGDESFDSLIADAEKQGILVTSQNTELPKAQAAYSANGFGYVGAKNYPAGQALGAEAAKRSGAKSGDRAMVWGLLSQPTRG